MIAFLRWWWAWVNWACPHCGAYCSGNTVHCCPPIGPEPRPEDFR